MFPTKLSYAAEQTITSAKLWQEFCTKQFKRRPGFGSRLENFLHNPISATAPTQAQECDT
jgi:hypothetical protein